MRVSQRKIANELRLSPMTVSRALRGENGIGEENRRRILEAARTAGLPLPASRKLAGNPELRHMVCVLYGTRVEAVPVESDSPFSRRLTEGMSRGASECASETVLCGAQENEWPTLVAQKLVDGVVQVCGDEREVPVRPPCAIPQVYVFHGPPHADVVTVNDSLGGYALGLRLAELGHRRVAFIGPDTWMAWSRLFGLRLALQRTGGACPPEVVCMRRRRGGQEALFMDALLAGETRPDAIRQRFTAARASQKKQFLFGVGGKAKAEGWSEQKRKGGEGV